jgi:glycosyltransferase involved in cell wall biosynthesis
MADDDARQSNHAFCGATQAQVQNLDGLPGNVQDSKMMRIAFDDQTFTQQTYGGISRYFFRLVEALNAAGDEAKIFAPLHINSYIESLPKSAVAGHRVDHYPYRTARFFTGLNHWAARRAIAKWRPQLIHETYFAKTAAAINPCPVVVTVYDMIHELFPESFSNRVDTRGAKRAAVHRADHVICISENTKRDLMRILGVPEQKISVIYLACDTDVQQGSDIQEELDSTKPFLLFVGARAGYKNFNRVLQALSSSAALMRDFDLLAFGGGSFSVTEKNEILSLGFAADQVRHVSGDDRVLGRLYRHARAFIYPSIYEGFGIPPLEAMSQGCPVVSSNASSIPEVVAQAGVCFNPLDVQEIRDALESVVYDDAYCEQLRLAGYQRVAQFSWERCARETACVYRSLI